MPKPPHRTLEDLTAVYHSSIGRQFSGLVEAERAALLAYCETDVVALAKLLPAMLPGIVRAAYTMPDIHQGYGFPIGGVVAVRAAVQGRVERPGPRTQEVGLGALGCGAVLVAQVLDAVFLAGDEIAQSLCSKKRGLNQQTRAHCQ